MDPATADPSAKPRLHTPIRVWVGLAIAVILDAPVQLMWKALMLKYRDPSRGPHDIFPAHAFDWYFTAEHFHVLSAFVRHHARWYLHQSRSWGLLALFACQFFDWIWVLGNADLSFAQPFTALSYVVVSSCAVLFFHEHLSPLRMAGIGAILIGVILVGSSDHRTTPKELA